MSYHDNQRSGVSIRGRLTDLESAKALVHFRIPATRDGVHEARPLCGNGAFHLKWTESHARVNCPACKEHLKH